MTKNILTLPENHKRSLSALAVVSEERMRSIEHCLIASSSDQNIMTRSNDDISQSDKDEILSRLAEFRVLLLDFRNNFGLGSIERSMRSEVSIAASYLWEDLAGAIDSKMAAYGHIPFEIEKEAKRCLKQMITTVNSIRSAAALSK